jgi:hypothetical protein
MPSNTDALIDSFVSRLKDHGVPIRAENNASRLDSFQAKLPKRLPQSFESFLSRYSFPTFNIAGIALFAWDSEENPYVHEARAAKGSLSELLLPAGYVQVGQPDTGSFDAVCFNLSERNQNRECSVVRIDHEEILCNWRVKVSHKLFSSFLSLVEDFFCPHQLGFAWGTDRREIAGPNHGL